MPQMASSESKDCRLEMQQVLNKITRFNWQTDDTATTKPNSLCDVGEATNHTRAVDNLEAIVDGMVS
jgi:hypothetical protein